MDNTPIHELIFSNDQVRMNWLREDYPYARVICPEEFSWTVQNEREGDELTTTIQIRNDGKHAYFTNTGSIGITFPVPDKYDSADVCLEHRCHAHIFCGGNTSYVMCLRMGGGAPHLGMVLTEGSLSGYSVNRDLSRMSNDRGCFVLHPSPREFAPGETMRLSWKLFPHQGKEDFYDRLQTFLSVVLVESDCYVLFAGESSMVTVRPSFEAKEVRVNGKTLSKEADGTYRYLFAEKEPGEYTLPIEADQIRTFCRLYVQEPLNRLVEKRVQFIVENQQYGGPIEELKGAYLAYDNEEKQLVYTPENDFNAGRERTGMGVLVARFLQRTGAGGHPGEEESLKRYKAYYLRELVDAESGLVCNDAGRDNSFFRLYNYPWAATFFVECYKLWKQHEDLETAARIIEKFYTQGCDHFYPLQLPIASICEQLAAAGANEKRDELKKLFCRHADWLIAVGNHYPALEVNYEQSIIAPAADVLLQVYEITGNEKYLRGARKQLAVLELFNGRQPDYHLCEVAIRHWDGYWFGKRRMYGDTFPHYWSAETGRVYRRYARLTGEERYAEKAETSLRGVLPMFFRNGTATCAYLYPYSANDRKGQFADPYANDQDWGLCSSLEE